MAFDWEKYHILNVLIASTAFLFLFALKKVLIRKLTPLVRGKDDVTHDFLLVLVKNTHLSYLLIAAVYLGFLEYDSSERVRSLCDKAFILMSLFQVSIWGKHFIEFASNRYFRFHDGSENAAIHLFNFIGKLCLYVLILLLMLHNLGVNITTLVTGLGVGGIAIALAVQNILGDLFASITIVLDKPFVLGDAISVDNFSGSVEYIGMKTTRLRADNGEQVIFPNADLLRSRIRNFKRMNERRVPFTLGITYETPQEKLQQIPAIVKEIVQKRTRTRFDRANFVEFGGSSLNFEIVYWILDRDFILYRDTHQSVCFEIFERFSREGIGFAYPTQTIYQFNQAQK